MKTPFTTRFCIAALAAVLCSFGLNAQGPNAPEAGSFEPVDATDMVSLITGDLTYVLPLMNVPSPEGGYPIALAYHAGIAVDQEASWAGLGWNLNPGAINRTVNGYPDDYNNAVVSEYFYDEGETIREYSASISVGFASGLSIGVGASWGSHKGLSGSVSIGIGPKPGDPGPSGGVTIGNGGVGINVGYQDKGGLSIGANVNSVGTIGGSVGFTNTNGDGFSIGANNQGAVYVNASFEANNDQVASIGVSFSSSGVGIQVGIRNKTRNQASKLNAYGGGGIGIHLALNNAISMENFVTNSSSWFIPIITPWGVSGSFGKKTFTYYLAKKEIENIAGTLYFKTFDLNDLVEVEKTSIYTTICDSWGNEIIDASDEGSPCEKSRKTKYWRPSSYELSKNESFTGEKKISVAGFMDIYEISIESNGMKNTDLEESNLNFPAYDKYNVQAQGLSGSISPRIYENAALTGISNKSNDDYTIDYGHAQYPSINTISDNFLFKHSPSFTFENEIASYFGTSKVTFDNSENIGNDLQISFNEDVNGDGKVDQGEARPTSNYVKHYTKKEVANNPSFFLKSPQHQAILKMDLPDDALVGFQITAVDGKTYHYSLPVFNHEIITRTTLKSEIISGEIVDPILNISALPKSLPTSYYEKRQLTPFATHWLLTAVTGPDFVDNGDGVAGSGDLGYWVRMDYGLWSDAFVWKLPVNKLYFEDPSNPKSKTWFRGRKQLYYLNSIKTRTHTALFEKSKQIDNIVHGWKYSSVNHIDDGKLTDPDKVYTHRFSIDKHPALKLDRILLFKNKDLSDFNMNRSNDPGKNTSIDYYETGVAARAANYANTNNIVDTADGLDDYVAKAQKVVALEHEYRLKDNPFTLGNVTIDEIFAFQDQYYQSYIYHLKSLGKPHLSKVHFKGKSGTDVLPPYSFTYNSPLEMDREVAIETDDFGYNKSDSSLGSLLTISTPQGANIDFNYDTHDFYSASIHSYNFSVNNKELDILNQSISYDLFLSAEIKSAKNIGIVVGNRLTATIDLDLKESVYLRTGIYSVYRNRKIDLRVTEKIDDNHFKVASLDPILYPSEFYSNNGGRSVSDYSLNIRNILFTSNDETVYTGGGPRVASIKIKDGEHQTSTQYTYGSEETPYGYVAYNPNAPNLQIEIPYRAELPAPKVLYEYVTTEQLDQLEEVQSKMRYRFNVLKSKDTNKIKYGDFYEIIFEKKEDVPNNLNKKVNIGEYTVIDRIASLGQLLSVTTLNKEDQVLSETVNEYYQPHEIPDYLGITQESFQSYKGIDYSDHQKQDQWYVGASTRIKYPNLLKRTATLSAHYSDETFYQDFNPITGFAETLITTDYQGNRYKTNSIPAYKNYPLPFGTSYGMGSKFFNTTNKNMLSQTAQTATYIEKNGEWKPLSVGISTWKKWDPEHFIDGKDLVRKQVWRKHQTYVWDGPLDADGTYASFEEFNWTSEIQTNPRWRAVQTTTRYDAFSKPLEQRDINNNYSSIHRGDGDTKTLAAVNAPYTAYACHGFEYDKGFSGGSQTSKKAHTGNYGLEINQDSPGVSIVSIGGKYQLSVWVEKDKEAQLRVSENGSLKELNGETVTAGEWVQRTHYFDLASGSATIGLSSASGSLVIDDFRLLPISSQATTYVYNQWDELSYILGANNMATHYTYTPSGKLESTATEVADVPGLVGGFKKTAHYQYNYKNALE